MIYVRAVRDILVTMSGRRMNRLFAGHPETELFRQRIVETLEEPALIQEGDDGTYMAVRSYPESVGSIRFFVVIFRLFKSGKGTVVTAYYTRKPSSDREVVWSV